MEYIQYACTVFVAGELAMHDLKREISKEK